MVVVAGAAAGFSGFAAPVDAVGAMVVGVVGAGVVVFFFNFCLPAVE